MRSDKEELETSLDIIGALVDLSEALSEAIELLSESAFEEKPDELEQLMTSSLGATNNARMFVATVREDL